MSPQVGFVLVQEIVPRIRASIAGGVRTVGAEDIEELIQDAVAQAANMLHRIEERGKEVTPGNIAFYAVKAVRSGRRSTGATRTDTLAPGTQLDGNSLVLSFEEPVGFDQEMGESVSLGELMVADGEDPSMVASRNLDWDDFLDTHNPRYAVVVEHLATGKPLMEAGRKCRLSPSGITALKTRLAEDLGEYMGPDCVREAARLPRWSASLQVEHEKAACRAERRTL
jgi:hypothetical protein